MKRLFIMCVSFVMGMANIASADNIRLEDVTGGKLRATYISAVTPLPDGDSYACIDSNGKKLSLIHI